jgi:hypothetical protein
MFQHKSSDTNFTQYNQVLVALFIQSNFALESVCALFLETEVVGPIVKQIDKKLWLLSPYLGAREFERIGRLHQLVEEAGDSALEETSSRRSGRRRSSGEPTAIWEVSGSQPGQAMALPSSMEVRMGDGWVEGSTLRAALPSLTLPPLCASIPPPSEVASLCFARCISCGDWGAVSSDLVGQCGGVKEISRLKRGSYHWVWLSLILCIELSLGLIVPDFVHRV